MVPTFRSWYIPSDHGTYLQIIVCTFRSWYVPSDHGTYLQIMVRFAITASDWRHLEHHEKLELYWAAFNLIIVGAVVKL
jgi:ABC-type tungstate transport system permease subunit